MRKQFTTRTMVTSLVPILCAGMVMSGCAAQQATEVLETEQVIHTAVANTSAPRPDEVTPDMAQQLLVEGNQRFRTGNIVHKDLSAELRENLSKNGQSPFAIIIHCSDSRNPSEIIFDQGLGDLFVIRVAGNVADPVEIGSVEYAVEHLGVPLIVVLGHEKCGAVKAAIEGGESSESLKEIFNNIQPAIDQVKSTNPNLSKDQLITEVENENAKKTTRDLLKSTTIKNLVDQGKVKIVAAHYDLEKGEVRYIP